MCIAFTHLFSIHFGYHFLFLCLMLWTWETDMSFECFKYLYAEVQLQLFLPWKCNCVTMTHSVSMQTQNTRASAVTLPLHTQRASLVDGAVLHCHLQYIGLSPQVIDGNTKSVLKKFKIYFKQMYNVVDLLAIIVFTVAFLLKASVKCDDDERYMIYKFS